jgi:hypothetical protein
MSEQSIEAEIQAKGLTAPRLTPELIEKQIISETYLATVEADRNGNDVIVHDTKFLPGDYNAQLAYDSLKCLTICVLVLRNGYTVVGKSACASRQNFDADLGRKIAREDARRQIWALEGYALKSKLAHGEAS